MIEANASGVLTLQKHFNFKQRLVIIINGWLVVIEWARGTGKSTGPGAWRIVHCAKVMPRSAGTFSSPSFRKFTDHMWPAYRKAFEELYRLKEGRDYVMMKTPPEHWPRPYMAPASFKYFITFRNGSGMHITSQDHNQTENALDTDWHITDEAKLQNGDRIIQGAYKTLRGNRNHFGHRPEHYSRWILSDRMVRAGSNQNRWYADYQAQASSEAEIQEIIEWYLTLKNCKNPILRAAAERELFARQKGCILYSLAETMDNIHAVGEEYIMNEIKSGKPAEVLASIFNMEIKTKEGSRFYPLFNEVLHAYNDSHNNRVEEFIWEHGHEEYLNNRSCRFDSDLQKGKNLKGFFDFGGTFNWSAVAQKQQNIVKFLKNFSVERPKKLRDLVRAMTEYYRFHDKKVIEIYYGVDANAERAADTKTDIVKLKEYFEEEGWTVIDMMEEHRSFIRHKKKYDFWLLAFDFSEDRDDRIPKVMFNSSNCLELIWSISNAMLKPGEKEYEKDKRDEKKLDFPQWKATHLSDAIDWLAVDYLDCLDEDSNSYLVSFHNR